MAPIIIENKMKQYQQFKDNKVHNGLFSLMTWFSPSYPIGSFAYSHGLEYAVEAGIVTNTGDLKNWLYDFLHFGTCYNDSIFISNSYDATEKNDLIFFNEVAAMSKAFKSSSEISLESEQQGISFYQVTSVTLSSKKFESLINGIKRMYVREQTKVHSASTVRYSLTLSAVILGQDVRSKNLMRSGQSMRFPQTFDGLCGTRTNRRPVVRAAI